MKDKLEKFIADNREELDQQIPDPAILARIMQQMHEGKKKEAKGLVIPFRVVYWAAAACALLIVSITVLINWPQVKVKAPVVVRIKPAAEFDTKFPKANPAPVRSSVDSVDEDLMERKAAWYARLKQQQQPSRKKVMLASLRDMDSPASRITAAAEAYSLKNTNDDVVNALVHTLNHDPSANVRLAALDGLAKFYRETSVRKKLVAALPQQQDPVVQIPLIELLTRMKESGMLSELDKLIADENTLKAVKDCAYSSKLRLGSI